MECPCKSGKRYEECCKPLHEGALAASPLALMRSRFSAYALGLVDYILSTTHPKNRPFPTREEVKRFCEETVFVGLEILEVKDSTVTFRAGLSQRGQPVGFTEKSLFEKVEGQWKYLSGEIL